MKHLLTLLIALLHTLLAVLHAAEPAARLLPPGWNAKQAADKVMEGLVKITAPEVKGAHDAEFVCVGDRAFVVMLANNLQPGESAAWPFCYATLSVSKDGRTWTRGEHRDFVPNEGSSKPTFDQFGGLYYLGWQERTKINGVGRNVFNVDASRDGNTWERKYRFETEKSFQYPAFHEHNGSIWLSVTQGDTDPSRKERIMFGKLE